MAHIPGVEVLAADLHTPALPLADGAAHVVQCAVLFHEMRQPISLLREIRRVLRPGGRLLVLDWVRCSLDDYFDGETAERLFAADAETAFIDARMTHFFEHNRYTVQDLEWLLDKSGFVIKARELRRNGQFALIAAE